MTKSFDSLCNSIINLESVNSNTVKEAAPKSGLLAGSQLTPRDIEMVQALAQGQSKGAWYNPFDKPQKDIERAYGSLLKKLSDKVKNVATTIQ